MLRVTIEHAHLVRSELEVIASAVHLVELAQFVELGHKLLDRDESRVDANRAPRRMRGEDRR
jgi:hypothetical protein